MTHIPEMGRRQALRLGASAAAVVGFVPLVGCSTGKRTDSTLVRVGAADGTNSSGLDPRSASNGASLIVMRHVYDSLMVLEDGSYRMGLAESVQPNADATRWTVRIRPGVTFHDGRPVRAADVAYSIRTLATPPSNRASVYADVDVANLKVIDEQTVELPLRRQRGDFRESILAVYSTVFPDGTTDFTKAIGSGPYRLSGSDERTVRLEATGDHWSGAVPSVKQLEISRIADAAARLSAVTSGQLDYVVGVSATGAVSAQDLPSVEVLQGGAANSNALSFAMNQQLAPFNDPRVRRAVRLIADRPALIANALMGLGTVGADVVGKDLPGYSSGISERRRDVVTARQLFRDAGVSTLTLRAAEIVPGVLAAAKLLTQQMAEAGVRLTVQQVPADTYYADLSKLQTYPFQAFYYANRPAAVHLSAVTNAKAVFNVTGAGPDYWQRLTAAQGVIDDGKRAAVFDALQREFYESGGDLLWVYQELLNVTRSGLRNVRLSQSVPLFDRAQLG